MRERLKNLIPNWAKTIVRKTIEKFENGLVYRKNDVNCRNLIVTSHKCGSQWFKSIFGSRHMHNILDYHYYAFKLLPLKGFDTTKLTKRRYDIRQLKPGIYGPIYVGPSSLNGLKDSDNIYVVIRDPRNLIVSWYESLLKTHALMGNVGEMREQLKNLPKLQGLDLMIDHAVNFGTFEVMEEWALEKHDNPRVKIVKFEDLFSGNQEAEFEAMLNHFHLDCDKISLSSILSRFSFKRLSKANKHYKKGRSRTWKNDLNHDQVDRIENLCPNIMNLYSNS